MLSVRFSFAFAMLLLAGRTGFAQPQKMTVTRIADGVYGALWSEMETDPVQSNSLIIVGTTGVAVVDAHYTPSAARATIAAIRKLTALPVRYVITTHWHDDHIFGNQAYARAYPGVQFVAHAATAALMQENAIVHRDGLIDSYSKALISVPRALATGKKSSGDSLTAEERAFYAPRIPLYRRYLADFRSVQPVMPTITFDHTITLQVGGREVQVMNFGSGNTEGDAVIFLPKEKIAAVGDLIVYPVPFIYGGFPASWVKVLTAVRALGPTTIVPGHGPVMRDYVYFNQVVALMQSLATQARHAVDRGLSVDSLKKVIDLKSFYDAMTPGHAAGEGTFAASILSAGVVAAYEEAKKIKS